MLSAIQSIPLSLYVHMPWCIKKCPYCDFNSHALKNTLPEQQYIDALVSDLKHDKELIADREISSIFFGGGTPSLFSDTALGNLFEQLTTNLHFAKNIEITLEANPGTVEAKYFAGYYDLGINRLSIGVQSFNNKHLILLGRIHDAQQATNAIKKIKNIGFENFNIDIMFGLPEQSVSQALSDLQQAIDLTPTHISWYQLTLEPNTLFAIKPPALPTDEVIWEMQQQGQALLAENGYTQYEISAYAQANMQCKHNNNYWQFGDYLGIGAGAHGKLTLPDKTIRLWKIKHPKTYLENENKIGELTTLAERELVFEFMLNHLRLNQTVKLKLFEQRTGLDRKTITANLEQAQQQGLIEFNEQDIVKTDLGQRFLNDLQTCFLQ
jgi:oxygen-independent coproporphyrinogen-3 oxidase